MRFWTALLLGLAIYIVLAVIGACAIYATGLVLA